MKRVPIQTPSAPSASAAARPRPSKMPPAATTGTRSPTASTTWGTSGMVATVPGVPAGLGALGDDEVAAGLDRGDRVADLAAHVDHEDVVVVAQLDDLARHAERGDEHRHPLRDEVLDVGEHLGGQRGEQVDAERLRGSGLDLRGSRRPSRRCPWSPAPRQPNPPASDTAATSRWYDTPPIPASITGCSIWRSSVSRVRTGSRLGGGWASVRPVPGSTPLVGVIMGSDSDLRVMQGAVDVLTEFQVSHEVRIVSAHRTPDVHVRVREPARPTAGCGSSSPGPAAPPTCRG